MPKTYDFEDFCQITAALRKKEGGCPWDLIQTHESLKPYMVSETAEALAAVDLYDQTKDSDCFRLYCKARLQPKKVFSQLTMWYRISVRK